MRTKIYEFQSIPVSVNSGSNTSIATTVSSISLSLNGTGVHAVCCTETSCYNSIVSPHIFSAAISEVGVGESECVVTVSWSKPVISCNGFTSQYVFIVSPNTTECPYGSCEVGRGEERFEKERTECYPDCGADV